MACKSCKGSFLLLAILILAAISKAYSSKYLIVTPQVYRAGLAAEISVTLFNISERTVIKAKLTKGNDKMVERNVIFSPEDAAPVKDTVMVGSKITAFVKTMATLPCIVSQKECDLVEWTRVKNGTTDYVLTQYGNMTVVGEKYKDRVSLINGKDLQIIDLRASDEDNYFCNAVNCTKTGILAPVELLVLASQLKGEFVIKHNNGLCVVVDTNSDRLLLSRHCNETFILTARGNLKHVKTGKCAMPEFTYDDASIDLSIDCDSTNSRFVQTEQFSVRHIATGKCIHPYWGHVNPTPGTELVIFTGCDEKRLQFKFTYNVPNPVINLIERKMLIKIPKDFKGDELTLKIAGSGGLNFENSKKIHVEKPGVKVFIQTDKPVYKPGEKVRFRVLVITTHDLKPAKGKVADIAIMNPTGSRIVQWKNKELDEGFVSLDLTLSTKPLLGAWKITATYQGVSTEVKIEVAKYVLPKFEVTMEMPDSLYYNRRKFNARVCAKYTYVKDVDGMLTASFCYNGEYTDRRGFKHGGMLFCTTVTKRKQGIQTSNVGEHCSEPCGEH